VQGWVDALEHNQTKLLFQQLLVEELKKGGVKLPGMA